MTALLQDLRLAVRVLLGTKPWTLVVLLSLAVGIGANTALFTAVNGLLLQTVNVYEPERLVRFNHAGPNDMVRNSNDYGYSGRSGTRIVRSTFSFPMIEQLRAANTTLTGLAAGVPMGSLNVFVDGDAQLATGYQATGNYFTVIGVPAVRGRVFGEADDRPSAPPVAVISHAYWSKRFAGAPSAIGRVVSIKGQMVTIVGVTPADFAGIERLGADGPDVTVPLAFDALFAPPVRVEIPRMQQPTYWWLQLVGRLKPGVLAVLLACIGLFGLMSYNVARRTSEIGVRLALGAQRRTLIGMVMSESIRLVAIGIVLGLAAVLWAGRFVQTVVYGLSPSDPLTIGGAVALIAGVTALAGGVPARRASKVNPIEALRQQ